MHQPFELYLNDVKKVLRYLKGSLRHGLYLKQSSSLYLNGYFNVDWAKDKDDHTSTSTYIVYFSSNSISRCYDKQKRVVYPSIEVEYQIICYNSLK